MEVYDYTNPNFIYSAGLVGLPPGSAAIENQIRDLNVQLRAETDPQSERALEIIHEINELAAQRRAEYLASFGDEDSILASARALLDTITKADVDAFIQGQRDLYIPRLEARKKQEAELGDKASDTLKEMNRQDEALLKKQFNFTFDGAWAYLAGRTYWQMLALMQQDIPLAKWEALLDEYAATFYKPRKRRSRSDAVSLAEYNAQQLALPGFFDEPYKKMFQGIPNTMLQAVNTRGAKPDQITGALTVRIGKRIVTINSFADLTGEFGASTNKIFSVACAQLAAINPYKPPAGAAIQATVRIDLREYAKACGEDVEPRYCETEADMVADKARIKKVLDNVADQLRQDGEFLANTQLTYTDGPQTFDKINLISRFTVRGGVIRINFDVDMARQLANAYLQNLPLSLLRLSNKSPNSFSVGMKLAFQFGLDANVMHGTNTRLRVKNILAAMPKLKKYDELVASGNRNWKRLIKAPFENTMQELTDCGYLSRWAYYDGDTELTPEQAARLRYYDWEDLIIEFTPADELPDQSARLAAKAERIALAEAKTEKKKRGRPRKNK